MSRLPDQDTGNSGITEELAFCNRCEQQFPRTSLAWIAGCFTCESCRPEVEGAIDPDLEQDAKLEVKIPDNPASIGMAFLAFVAFFAVKGSLAMFSRMHGHHESD